MLLVIKHESHNWFNCQLHLQVTLYNLYTVWRMWQPIQKVLISFSGLHNKGKNCKPDGFTKGNPS